MSPAPGRRTRALCLGGMPRRAGLVLLGLAAAFGCYSPGDGTAPPNQLFYFPTGIALSASGKHLFLANSDFDLRYNAGTLLALDMRVIRDQFKKCRLALPLLRDGVRPGAPDPANDRPDGGAASANTPNCQSFPVDQTVVIDGKGLPLIQGSVKISAFAGDIQAVKLYDATTQQDVDATAPPGQKSGRLLIPVRGDATLTYVDYTEAGDDLVTLGCYDGARPNEFDHRCDDAHRRGDDPGESSRNIKLEGEPFSIAVSQFQPAGGVAAIVHQQTGDVSLFVNVDRDKGVPVLSYTLTGLPAGGTSITALDLPGTPGVPPTPRFLVTNRVEPTVRLVSFYNDPGQQDRGGLTLTETIPIPTNSPGYDTRGVVVDPPNEGEIRPTRVFMTSRTPASLITGEIDPATQQLHFFGITPLPVGPSRLTRGVETVVVDGAPVPRTRIYASSYDAQTIVVYDPNVRSIVNLIHTGRGPYAIATPPPAPAATPTTPDTSPLGFIANFTESTIDVIGLDPTDPRTYQQVVCTIGVPTTPGS